MSDPYLVPCTSYTLAVPRSRRPLHRSSPNSPDPVPKASKRIWNPRPAGLDPARSAPFWRGVTAEQLVAKRKRLNDAAKAAKKKR